MELHVCSAHLVVLGADLSEWHLNIFVNKFLLLQIYSEYQTIAFKYYSCLQVFWIHLHHSKRFVRRFSRFFWDNLKF